MKQDNLELVSEIVKTSTLRLFAEHAPEQVSVLENIIAFRENLSNESDRGLALMAAAYIDDRLAVLLRSYFVDNGKILRRMFDFTGPLGNFSARLDMAYSLGLIAKNIYNDCNTIKKIRNDFAHDSSPLTFHDEPIQSKCLTLTTHGIDHHKRPKALFTRTIMSILLEVETAIREINRCVAKEDFDASNNKHSIESLKDFIKANGLEFEGYENM